MRWVCSFWFQGPSVITPEVELGQAIMLKAYEADWGPIQHEGDLHDRATYRYYWEALQRARLMKVKLSDEIEKLFFSDGS